MMSNHARMGVAAVLTAAGLLGLSAPAHAANGLAADTGEVTGTVSNLSSARAQGKGYVLAKCPSTMPYIKGTSATTKTGNQEDLSYGHYDEFWQSVPDGSAQAAKVNFHNSQTYAEESKFGPVVVTVTLTLTCSNVKPAGLPRPQFKQSVHVNGHSYGNLQITCPANYPTALEAVENHSYWFTSYGTTVSGGMGAATWYNTDELVFGTADLTVACGP
ncbi:hypothetical protein [Nonomuraea sp. NPDC005501]|uniref:hypothetical protein n=1 Tax=Nonomuraea sp. NPDC005501 TaxID=3156884 RepID=UPI0033B9671B